MPDRTADPNHARRWTILGVIGIAQLMVVLDATIVNIALPASFQHRKNQLDAIRALSRLEDDSVHLTLWGNISPLNPYFIAVNELIDSLGLRDRVSIPGFGKLIVDAVFNRDYAVVQGVVLTTATIYITLNLIADIAYILVNPRLRG